MNTFDDRKKAFESKYANDAEMQFKVMAKRNKFVGLWAAELLGKSGNDAENYYEGQENYDENGVYIGEGDPPLQEDYTYDEDGNALDKDGNVIPVDENGNWIQGEVI